MSFFKKLVKDFENLMGDDDKKDKVQKKDEDKKEDKVKDEHHDTSSHDGTVSFLSHHTTC